MSTAYRRPDLSFGFIPIEKSIRPTHGYYLIGGYASTGSLDYQGERVEPVGLNLDYFRQDGYVDYEHQLDKKIGVPVECHVDDKGLYVKAKLFPRNKYVKGIMNLLTEMKEAGVHRHLGFSIEGQVRHRDPIHKNIITSILITGVAVTANPANTDASWSLLQKSIWANNKYHDDAAIKSLLTGYGDSPQTQQDGGALRPQSLAYKLHMLSYSLGNLDKVNRKRLFSQTLKYLNKHYAKDIYSPLLALQMMSGCSISIAQKAINTAKKSLKESED